MGPTSQEEKQYKEWQEGPHREREAAPGGPHRRREDTDASGRSNTEHGGRDVECDAGCGSGSAVPRRAPRAHRGQERHASRFLSPEVTHFALSCLRGALCQSSPSSCRTRYRTVGTVQWTLTTFQTWHVEGASQQFQIANANFPDFWFHHPKYNDLAIRSSSEFRRTRLGICVCVAKRYDPAATRRILLQVARGPGFPTSLHPSVALVSSPSILS
jgi:hypothetical protein